MPCDRFRVGYEGQRYECYATTHEGEEEKLGWTSKSDGGPFVNFVDLNPRYKQGSLRVLDLEEESGEQNPV